MFSKRNSLLIGVLAVSFVGSLAIGGFFGGSGSFALGPQHDAGKNPSNSATVGLTRNSEQVAEKADPSGKDAGTDEIVEAPMLIRVSNDLAIQALHENGLFVGYQVASSDGDSRFSNGDVIIAIDGSPVEDSAAGGEILSAALASRSAEFELRGQQ